MAFHLEITIAGMCLLVRDSDAAPNMLHVLMPDMSGSHAHDAKLLFLKKYLPQGGGSVEKEEIDLAPRRLDLDLSGLSASNGLSLSLPGVFPFDTLGREVDRTLLRGSVPPEAVFRMRLSAGAVATDEVYPGGFWWLVENGKAPPPQAENLPTSVRMATAVKWRLENVSGSIVSGDKLTLDLGGDVRVLTALDEGKGKVIRLFILHVPSAEIPASIPTRLPRPSRVPNPDEKAGHFLAHYKLLTPPVPEFVPMFHRKRFDDEGAALTPNANFGSEFTCMVATAPVR